jgi:uncharacterized protein YjbI with pentapeptide repeats
MMLSDFTYCVFDEVDLSLASLVESNLEHASFINTKYYLTVLSDWSMRSG